MKRSSTGSVYSADRQRHIQLVGGLLDMSERTGMTHGVGPLVGELHADPLQVPQGLAHAGVGLGLGHDLAAASAPAEAAPPHPSPHAAHAHAVVHAGRESHAAVDHRSVRELADRHRDGMHRPDAVALVVTIEPRETHLHGPQPRDDRSVIAL